MRGPYARVLVWGLLVCAPVLARAADVRDNFYGVKALSATDAWAAGNFGTLYRTGDGGKTWTPADSGTRLPLFGIDFADQTVGWAVGKSGVILATTDGGKRWKVQESPIPVDKHLFKVEAIDARTAWAVGDWGAIAYTNDGGVTWQDRSLGKVTVAPAPAAEGEQPPMPVSDDTILYGVSFPDAQHGYIGGEFGTILATDDGGTTWRQIHTPTQKTLFGLHFSTPLEGWAVGIDGLVIHTVDGGSHWDVQRGHAEAAAVDEISFVESMQNPGMYAVRVDGKNGIVVGDVGMLLVSTDGGRSWKRHELPDKDQLLWLRDVSFAPGAGGFLVGASGFAARVQDGTVTVPRSGKTAGPAS